jgi:hypothetical protein
MSKIMAIVCGLFLFSTAASGQRFNAFVGYSHIGFGPNLYSLQLDPLSPPLRRSKNGWKFRPLESLDDFSRWTRAQRRL